MRLQHGFTLIEAMTAFLIATVGLIGLASVQSRGISHSYEAFNRTQAVFIAMDLQERIRANIPGVEAGAYDHGGVIKCRMQVDACLGKSGAPCSATKMAQHDMYSAACGGFRRRGGTLDAISSKDKFLKEESLDSMGARNVLPNGFVALRCSSVDTTRCKTPQAEFNIQVGWGGVSSTNSTNRACGSSGVRCVEVDMVVSGSTDRNLLGAQ